MKSHLEKVRDKFSLMQVTFIYSIISVMIALVSAILFLIGSDAAGAVGVVSTILSIVLGVVSIVYTYVSGQETIKALDKIVEQNKSLVNKINSDLLQGNFDEANIETLRGK